MADRWREDLIRAAALLEATIDFADEEVPVDVSPEVAGLLDGVRRDLERESSGVAMAERIRSGFEVAIIGAPNVGKSTLLNLIAGAAKPRNRITKADFVALKRRRKKRK